MAPNRPKEELYDLQNGPARAAQPRRRPETPRRILREHRAKLDEWIKATADKGETPEDPQVVAYWQDDMMKSYKQQMEKRGLSPDISDEDYLKWWEQKLLG